MYEGKELRYEVIDEVQYIENHTTATVKAVKVVGGRQPFALTGTSVENRLSELWSIFDYLMLGLLYGYETFHREMETPIVKNYDENEPWWNQAVQNQETDRAREIGQTRKVTVYKLIAKHTMEEKIQKLQETKQDLADQIISGETG